jgi:hypothetical protein
MPRVLSDDIVLKVKLANGKIWEASVIEYTSIDLQDMDTDLVEQPGKIAWINSLAAAARLERNRLKRNRTKLEIAKRSVAVKAIEAKDEKATEKAVEIWMSQQPDYDAVLDRMMQVDYEIDMLEGTKEALVHRRDALIALNLNRRREVEQDVGKTIGYRRQQELDEKYRAQLKERAGQRSRTRGD